MTGNVEKAHDPGQKGKQMKQYKTDVAIVGGGPAGLAAAISAAESGTDVILLEKTSLTGGASNMGMGPFAAGTRIQKKNMVGLDVDQAYRIFMDYTHYRTDARLVRKYIDKSADTIEWLQDMGVEFVGVMKYFPDSQASWHVVKPEEGPPGPRCASTMIKRMTERADELGVRILYETPACEIIMKEGRAAGVKADEASGEEVEITADAVIISTGGYGNNPEMVEDLLGYKLDVDFFPHRIPGIVGDGIKMAWAAGAGRSDMNMEITGKIHGLHESPMSDQLFRQPSSICVDLRGYRVFDEAVMENTTYLGNAVARLKNRCAFSIIDSNILKKWIKKGLDLPGPGPELDIRQAEKELNRMIDEDGLDTVFSADSLEELAEKIGLDKETFITTVEEYNEDAGNNIDTVFGKEHKYLTELKGPRYYAGRFNPSAYGSLGGIMIDHETRVLTDEWEIIPGLYSAGTDACSIYGDSYVFYLPGNTMGFCLNSGRIAGENAADYVLGE